MREYFIYSLQDSNANGHYKCTALYANPRIEHNLNSLPLMELMRHCWDKWHQGRWTLFSVFCLQYQVFPIQQQVQQQRTEELTYEVEDGPCTTHSGRLLHLPTFQLMEGEHPFLLLSCCPFSLFGVSFLSLIRWQVLSLCESVERCMSALPHSNNTLPNFHSMLKQPTVMLQNMYLCTYSWEITINLALYCGVIEWGCGMGGPPV